VVHRSRTLRQGDTTRHHGIPVTSSSRTLADLRRTLPEQQFAAALREAEFLGLHIDHHLDPDQTQSELEARFLALCRRHRLPRPEVNVRTGPFIADFLWSQCSLIVEVDGYRSHGSRSAFERDRSRDLDLKLRGYEVARFTWRHVADQPGEVAEALRRLLASPS
jgi:very-short-patch-repair endonuclease